MKFSFKLSLIDYKPFLPIVSAVLLTLSYPVFNLEFLAYFAFIPFFFTLNNKSGLEAAKFGFIFGILFFGLTIYWLMYVSILGYIISVLYLALYLAIFGFSIRYTLYAMRYISVFIVPIVWVLLEYARTHLFAGFGWVLLGYSQYLNLPVIQMADIAGVWGVSFLVMAVNIAAFKLLKEGFKKALATVLTVSAILAVSLAYGYFKLEEETQLKDLVISVIQGNIPQEQKWDESFKKSILATYAALTQKASMDEHNLIVWPETAIPGYIEDDELWSWVKEIAQKQTCPLLIGAPSASDFEKDIFYNSAVLIDENGEIVKRYNKLRLVPFGEYVPFERIFPFIRNLIDKPIGDFTPGNEYTIFKLRDGTRFGVLICFEDIFPGLVRNFVEKGADFLVNITNDAWFGKTSAPYQHAQASVFRAVENRVPVVRAANTGFSCFIDSKGRIIDKVEVKGQDIFVTGYKTSKIFIRKK